MYICFIDYTKAFDRVKHFKMIECLSEIGIDDKVMYKKMCIYALSITQKLLIESNILR